MQELLNRLFKTRRERIIFYATMGVILAALFFNFILYPIFSLWMEKTNDLKGKRSKLQEVNKLISREPLILEEFDKYQKGIRLKDPIKRAEDTLLLQADEIQKDLNIRFTRMDPVRKRNIGKSNYQAYSLQVIFEGDLSTIGKFLQGMQERGLYIDYLQVSIKSKAAHNPTLQAIVRMGKVVSKEDEKKANP